MSEKKSAISEALDKLEMKAEELSSDRFAQKSEEIKSEASERLVRYFIDVMCTIINAKENAFLKPQQGYEKMKRLYGLARERLNDMEYHHLTLTDSLLSRSQALMKTMHLSNGVFDYNIYEEMLDGNIKLPKIAEAWMAVEERYNNFIIIPGQISLDEIIIRAPEYFEIHIEKLKEDELRKTVERPETFYTLALSENENVAEDYPDGRRKSVEIAKSRMKETKERTNLNLTGLTIREYIWAQLFQVSKAAKFRTDPKKWGLDHECASYLMDDYVVNQKTGDISPTVGYWFSNTEKPNVSIANGSKGIRNFWPVLPRLAINFSGEKDE